MPTKKPARKVVARTLSAEQRAAKRADTQDKKAAGKEAREKKRQANARPATKQAQAKRAQAAAKKASKQQAAAVKKQRTDAIKKARTVAVVGDKATRDAFGKPSKPKKTEDPAIAQRKKDAKTARTVGKVGTKEEREKFRSDKERIERERKLAKMSPEQKKRFLAREQQMLQVKARQEEAEANAKAARTVAVVKDKPGREAFREAKEAIEEARQTAATQPQASRSAEALPRSEPSVINSARVRMYDVCNQQAQVELEDALALLS